MNPSDAAREVRKIADVLEVVDRHLSAEADMNAALHMNAIVRPAPLAVAVHAALVVALDLAMSLEDMAQPHISTAETPEESRRMAQARADAYRAPERRRSVERAVDAALTVADAIPGAHLFVGGVRAAGNLVDDDDGER